MQNIHHGLYRYNEQYKVLVAVIGDGMGGNLGGPVYNLAEQSWPRQRDVVKSTSVGSHDAFYSYNLFQI